MSEHGRDVGYGHAILQQGTSEGVSQVVQAVAANSGGFEDAGEPLTYAAFVEEAPLGVHEDQIGHVAPLVLEGLRLAHAVERGESIGEFVTHVDFASRAGFRGPDNAGRECTFDA